MFDRLGEWFRGKYLRPIARETFERERARLLERTPVPVFWMFGKTGSGKTSIIKYLTGAEHAQIGNGFRPETRASFKYFFPSEPNPLLEFLDTRGLGEIGYDPAEDIERFDQSTHLMIVTARVMDHALEPVIEPLRKIRKAKPDRPVVLALTTLHQLYPQQQHPDPDPFEEGTDRNAIPADLQRCLDSQRERFDGLVDAVVPIDFTQPIEGFEQTNFGGERLKRALIGHLPDAYRQTFLTLTDVMESLKTLHERRAMPYILSASTMAATAAAVPLPWVDIPVVAGIQSELIRRLAGMYGQRFDGRQFLRMAGAVGSRLVLRQIVRESLKIIPGVGHAANAALAFAATYGLGEACCWYYGERMAGHAPTAEELREVLKEHQSRAAELWQKHHQPEAAS